MSPPMERESTVVVVREVPIVAIRGDARVGVRRVRRRGRRVEGCMVLDEGWWEASQWLGRKVGGGLLTGISWRLPVDSRGEIAPERRKNEKKLDLFVRFIHSGAIVYSW